MTYQKTGQLLTAPRVEIRETENGEVFTRTLETLEPQPQIVFPPDTRTQVRQTTEFPYIAMGQLVMDFPNGKRYTGTGTLIDGRHVLTAAHNLYGNDSGGWALRVWFVPARNGDEMPFGILEAEKIFITEEYKTLSPPNPNATWQGNVDDCTPYTEDYGLVRLKKAINLPILGMYAASNHVLNCPARITGYPGDKAPENTMWTDSKNLTFPPDDTFLFYRINTFNGQSGAAVIADLDLPVGKSIVGIHVAGDPKLRTNFGVRLTRDIINQVLAWMNSDSES
jgi:glutamyl endopeptidase